MVKKIALYTTFYPAIMRFACAWADSIQNQTYKNFDVWIGLDSITSEVMAESTQNISNKIIFRQKKNMTPVQIRESVILEMASYYDIIVFIDGDDLLFPARVHSAIDQLKQYDVTACAAEIINEEGGSTGLIFRPNDGFDPLVDLVSTNIFGLSNTAYRCSLLEKILPIGSKCPAMDWAMISKAILCRARINFVSEPNIKYRQYGENIAKVSPPFNERDILKATEIALSHFNHLLGLAVDDPFIEKVKISQNRTETFFERVNNSSQVLQEYVTRLNALSSIFLWWECVAHPKLEEVWTR